MRPISEIVPLCLTDFLSQHKDFDGSSGTNRLTSEHGPKGPSNDLEAVCAWFDHCPRNKSTFGSYRKEVERLWLWALTQCHKPLSSLQTQDLEAYGEFIKAPSPAGLWVSADGARYPRSDPRWRPFSGPLSESSQRQTMVILGGMFGWLTSIGYLRANPMALCKIVKNRATYSERHLSDSLWSDVKCFIEQLPRDTFEQETYYFRCRWLTTLFYLQGMHISEVAKGQMSQFVCLSRPDGNEQWWLRMPAKAGPPRLVPVSLELIEELRRYREAMGLSSMPRHAEKTPLLLPLRGPRRCLNRSTVHDAIKSVFRNAASWLRTKGSDFEARADQLERASAHWLRRTAGWHMVSNGVTLQTVRDNLGYESAVTAFNLYLYPRSPLVHSLPDDRYNETTKRHKIRWEVAKPGAGNTDR